MEYSVLTTFKDIDIKDLEIKSNNLYPSCSSYLKDIILFDSNNYIEYLGNSSRYNIFFNFMENYKDIENEDFKKPIFSQTSKFKKNINNFNNYNYKFAKINRDKDKDKEKEKDTFIFENSLNENDKISVLIK